ncbi:MAG: hypothetical protein LBD99_07125 [Candidatus Margulisbacteria bacterium]|jgi:hypothetical protein|nr:hypothetical protein [Candidatus Margulisiibacteriota bacterium]
MRKKLIADQISSSIYQGLAQLSAYAAAWDHLAVIRQGAALRDILYSLDVGVPLSEFSEAEQLAGILRDLWEAPYTARVKTDALELYLPQAEIPRYILRRSSSQSLWLYRYLEQSHIHIPTVFILKHPDAVDNLDKLVHLLQEKLDDAVGILISSATEKFEQRKNLLKELPQTRQPPDALQKIGKFLRAALLLPVRFFVSEKFVREHSVFHFTYPEN